MGRASISQLDPIVITNALLPVVKQDRNRRMLLLGAPDAGVATYTTVPNATAGQGINIAAGQQPLVLNQDHWGGIVGQVWFAIGSVASANAAVGYSHFPGKPEPDQ